jgi:hypothetical protein
MGYTTTDEGFATKHRPWTVPTILLNTTLTLSSLDFAVPLPHNTHKVGRSQLARKSAAVAGISESLFLAFGVALYEYEYHRQCSSPAIPSNLSLS